MTNLLSNGSMMIRKLFDSLVGHLDTALCHDYKIEIIVFIHQSNKGLNLLQNLILEAAVGIR